MIVAARGDSVGGLPHGLSAIGARLLRCPQDSLSIRPLANLMFSIRVITVQFLTTAALIVCVSCASSNPDQPSPETGEPSRRGSPATKTGVGNATDTDLLGANPSRKPGRGPIVDAYDLTEEQFDEKRLDRFLRTRCIDLGGALVQLASPEKELSELGESMVQGHLESDRGTVARFVAAGRSSQSASGLIVPRYIAHHLRLPKGEWDRDWLARQGRLLQLSYNLETLDVDLWTDAVKKMLAVGDDGKHYLATQMVMRLRLADVKFRDFAKDILVRYVPDEAVDPLILATHVELANQPGMFPREAASTLALIGKSAVPKIVAVFSGTDGKYVPASDDIWKSRRYLIEALGEIGDPSATDLLVRELDTMKFKSEIRRDLYASVIVESMGKTRDKRAIPAIVKEWKRYADPSEFVEIARPALRRITLKIYSDPDDVPLD